MTELQQADLDCLARARAGDSRSLIELYDRHSPLMYRVALRILRRPADAEDALQDTWVQVWNRLHSYDPRRGSVVAWLVTLARSRALDRWRSIDSRSRNEARSDPEAGTPPEDPAARAVQGDLSARVKAALGQLTPQQRQVLEIAYFEGLSQSEIAERTRTPLGTVKSWTRQALARLREILPREEWA